MEQGFIKGRRGRWEDVRINGFYDHLFEWLKRLGKLISGASNEGLQEIKRCSEEEKMNSARL